MSTAPEPPPVGPAAGDEPIAPPRSVPPYAVAKRLTVAPAFARDPSVSPLRHALGEAARSASRILAEPAGKTSDEIRQQLDAIAEALSNLASGAANEPFEALAPTRVPRSYIDTFRSALLSILADMESPPSGRETVRLLAGLEEIVRRSEMTSTGQFVARLAGADSVNAVVEIAHDIRSPLSSILFLVDTIRRGQSGAVSPVQERQLGLVYGAALGLSTLSSDLIDAVRGERLVDGPPIPFSVTEIILNVCAIVQPISEEKGLPVEVSFPAVDGRIGYPSAINRVLLNLTTNALRYTNSGSVTIGCADVDEAFVDFWVSDTGAGIPESVLAMLFDGFRPGSMGLRFSSAGLGLAICRTLLEAMGSSLEIQTGSSGTRFSFRIRLPAV